MALDEAAHALERERERETASNKASAQRNMSSAQSTPPTSPCKRLSFSVDSLLSKTTDRQMEDDALGVVSASHTDNLSSDSSDDCISMVEESSNQSQLSSMAAGASPLSIAAALRHRVDMMRHMPAIPHNPLVYPWLMSANIFSNPATAALLASTPYPHPSKCHGEVHI